MRVVLDTNVWLDWLVFEDPAVIPLKSARQNDSIEIIIDTACRDELVRVLAYPKFKLDGQTQAGIVRQVDRLSRQPRKLDYSPEHLLPFCADPDDVKFQSLAHASHADWLITKDNALLTTRRKSKRLEVSYLVATPAKWAQLHADRSAPPC